MSSWSPVLPASWQPMHWDEVTNSLAALGPPASTTVLS